MKISELIQEMQTAGAPLEAIKIAVLAVEALEKKEADRRAKKAEQKRKERLSRDSRPTVARQSHPLSRDLSFPSSPSSMVSPPPIYNKTISPPSLTPSSSSLPINLDQFDLFWSIYPRKVAKGNARKAFFKAIKTARFQTILDGAERLASDRAGEDHEFTPHPATWLNGQRWLDEAPARKLNHMDKIKQLAEGILNDERSSNTSDGDYFSVLPFRKP